MKFVFSLFFALFGLAAPAAPPTAELSPLVVGTTSGYAPFVSLNAEGKYEGFDIDFATLLADKLGRKVVIRDCGSMPGLMLALKQGKVDLLLWAISITEDRMKTMEMVYYQGEKVTKIPLLFWKTASEGILKLEDLAKKSICVEGGSFQEDVLGLSQANLKYVDKIDDAILEIRYGKSAATAIDPSLIARFQKQYPEIRVLHLPIPQEKQALGNGVCISKKRPELVERVKRAVQELTAEGKIAELETKWKLVDGS